MQCSNPFNICATASGERLLQDSAQTFFSVEDSDRGRPGVDLESAIWNCLLYTCMRLAINFMDTPCEHKSALLSLTDGDGSKTRTGCSDKRHAPWPTSPLSPVALGAQRGASTTPDCALQRPRMARVVPLRQWFCAPRQSTPDPFHRLLQRSGCPCVRVLLNGAAERAAWRWRSRQLSRSPMCVSSFVSQRSMQRRRHHERRPAQSLLGVARAASSTVVTFIALAMLP